MDPTERQSPREANPPAPVYPSAEDSVVRCIENQWVQLNDAQWSMLRSDRGVRERYNVYFRRYADDPNEEEFIRIDPTRGVRFLQLAGLARIGGLTFQVRPKFMSGDDWVQRLIRMAALSMFDPRGARTVSLLPGAMEGTFATQEFLDLVAAYFGAQLLAALETGPLWVYERHQADVHAVRGRLMAHKQLQRPPHAWMRFPCDYSALTAENALVRLLSHAAGELKRRSRLPAVRSLLGVAESRLPPPALLEHIHLGSHVTSRVPPQARAYAEPVRIAEELMRSRTRATPVVQETALKRSVGFLIDMWPCFQALVSVLLHRVAATNGWRHQAQSERPYAYRRSANGAPIGSRVRSTTPDDAIFADLGGGEECLLAADAKYKGRVAYADRADTVAKRALVDPGDFYQLLTSCIAHGTTRGLLVQPKPEDLPDAAGVERWTIAKVGPLARSVEVTLVRLDMRTLSDRQPLQRLEEQIANALAPSVPARRA